MKDYHRGELRSSWDRMVSALDAAGIRYKVAGDHIQAVCPTHDDRRSSLSIDYKAGDAKVVFNCFTGCDPTTVLQDLGLTWPELYDDYETPEVYADRRRQERAQGKVTPQRKIAPKTKKPAAAPKGRLPKRLTDSVITPESNWEITATYDYVDTAGEVIHQEVRHERQVREVSPDGQSTSRVEKKFTQRWPDGKGGWLDKTPEGFEPVLYGMPDLNQWVATSRPIWLCEGVKDAERLLELDEAATTNPSGAANFKASQADALTGAHVLVVVDHDAAGYRRALRLNELLGERAATLRFALPRTNGRHQDASDHLDAGHGLNFLPATVEQLQQLEQMAIAEDAAEQATKAHREAVERVALADSAEGDQEATELRHALRWAEETTKFLGRACDAYRGTEWTEEALAERARVAVEHCRMAVAGSFEILDQPVPSDLDLLMVDPVDESTEVAIVDEPSGDVDHAQDTGTVVTHPTASRVPAPAHNIPMSRGVWAYDEGTETGRRRGVYVLNDSQWRWVAPLPFVKARIIRRDGSGRRTATVYLISAEAGEPGILIGHDELRSATWANSLGLRLSHDDKIQRAASTALIYHAEAAEEREEIPRVHNGEITIPVPDTLPAGYLQVADVERAEAKETWAKILRLAAKSPRLSLVLGAAAIAPYVAALDRQSHIVSLYGDAGNGKTVTMRAAGAIWGTTPKKGNSVVRPWNSTGNGVTRFLGQLGVLPGFFDESGQANASSPREWGKLIYDVCEGAQRMGAEMRGLGVRITMPWHGILISAGNGRLTDGLGAGRYAGVGRRVIELETPLTIDAEHAEELTELLDGAYGHMGLEILERHNADTIRPLIEDAERVLGMPKEGNERTVAGHLHAHLAGAMVLDQIAGTDGAIYYAALQGAIEYLEQWAPPEHDADRILDAIEDAIGREPAMWPEVDDYLEHKRPRQDWTTEGDMARLPQHGINRTLSGVMRTHDSGERVVYVFGHFWKQICEELGADSAVACRELNKREILRRTDSSRRAHEWTTKVRSTGSKMYALHFMPDPPEDQAADFTAPDDAPSDLFSPDQGSVDRIVSPQQLPAGTRGAESVRVPGESSGRSGSVPGDVPGANVPLTSSVPGVPGKTAEGSRMGAHARTFESHASGEGEALTPLPKGQRPPCVVCGTPAAQLVDGVALHLGDCAQALADREAAQPTTAADEVAIDDQPALPESLAEVASETTSPAEPVQESKTARSQTRAERGPRFTAPAAVLDDQLYLAGQAVRPLPEIKHLGDLALLTGRDQLRLGWGGGEDRFPDPGQIWLLAGALERLGFPTSMPLPEKALTKSQRATASQKLFAKLDDHPMVAGALDDGWELGQGGHMAVWTRIWHPELLPGGAFIVAMPWHHIEGVPLFAGDPGPADLVDRLHSFAQHVGVTYRLTTAATGLDLIDHHRPPRRSIDDDLGAGRGRVALVRNTPAELPPWRKKTSDARFTGLEQDFSWWRTWESLPDSEKGLTYVHGYDRNASYLTPWQSIDLGVEDLIHRVGDDAVWDGREAPGYYLVDSWEWPLWGLPDPGTAAGARVGNGRMWVTVHTLRQLSAHGIEPQIHESYTWGVTARYLEGPGKVLAAARKTLTAAQEPAEGDQAVLAAIKMLYSSTVGKLAEREHSETFHLWRPDWRDHVIGASKTAILRTLSQAADSSGMYPLVVDRDAVFFASDEADPEAAWPGDSKKLGTGLGSWKPIGSADLATWGPEHMAKRPGRWPYADAVDALQAAAGDDA